MQTIVAFREIGQGFSAIKTLCPFMNMPPPTANTAYDETNSELHNVYVQIAHKSTKEATKQIYYDMDKVPKKGIL